MPGGDLTTELYGLVAGNNASKLLTAYSDDTEDYLSGTSKVVEEKAAAERTFIKDDSSNVGYFEPTGQDAWLNALSEVCNEAIESARFEKNSTVDSNARATVTLASGDDPESGGYNLMKNAEGADVRVPILATTGLNSEAPKLVVSRDTIAATQDDDGNELTAEVAAIAVPDWGENNSFDSIKEVRQLFAGLMKSDDANLNCFNGMLQFSNVNGQDVDMTYPQMTTLFSSKNVVSGTSLATSNNYLNKMKVDFLKGDTGKQKLRLEIIKKKTNTDVDGEDADNAAATYHIALAPLGAVTDTSDAPNLNNMELELHDNPAATAANHLSLATSAVFSGAMLNELWAIEGSDAGTDIASYMRSAPTKDLYSKVASNAKQALNLDFLQNLKDAGATIPTGSSTSVFSESQFNTAYNQTAAADRTLVKVAAIDAVPNATFVAKFDTSATTDEAKLKAAIGYKRSWASEIEALETYASKLPYSKFIKSGASLGRNGIETSAQDEQLIYVVSPTDYKATPVAPSLDKFETFIADQTKEGATEVLSSLATDKNFSTKVASGETGVVMLSSNSQLSHAAALEVLFANGVTSLSGESLIFADPVWSMTFNNHIKYTSGSGANTINTSKVAMNSAVLAKTNGRFDSAILETGLLSVCEPDEYDAANPEAVLKTAMDIALNVVNTNAKLVELQDLTNNSHKLRILIREKVKSERPEGSNTWDAPLSNSNEKIIFSDFMILSDFLDFITEGIEDVIGGADTFYNKVAYGVRSSDIEDDINHTSPVPSLTGKTFSNTDGTINIAAVGGTISDVSGSKDDRQTAVNEALALLPVGNWSVNAITNFVMAVLFGNTSPTTPNEFADRMECMKLISGWRGKEHTVFPTYGLAVAEQAEDEDGNALEDKYRVDSGRTAIIKEFSYTPSGETAAITYPFHENWGNKAVLEDVQFTILRQRYAMPENIENISTAFASELAAEAATYESDRISKIIGSNAANTTNLQDAYKDLIALASVLKSKSLSLGDTIISAVIRNVNKLGPVLPAEVNFNEVKVAVMKAILEGHINTTFGTGLPSEDRFFGALPYGNHFSGSGMNIDTANATLNTTNAIRYIPLIGDFGMTPIEVLELAGSGDHPLTFVALLALTADNEGANQYLGTLEQARLIAEVNTQILQNLANFYRTLFTVDGYDRSAETTQFLIFKVNDVNQVIAETNTGIGGSASSFLINGDLDLV